MNILTFVEAAIKLGFPMVVLSWIIFTWLYGGGELDREANRRSINASVKKMKKSLKKKKDGSAAGYMVGKWMWFGSGFYGLAGLWTFAVIELADLIRLLLNPSSIAVAIDAGLVSTVLAFLANQLANLITALLWFAYWSDDEILVWLLVAYAGYWIGVELARRGEQLPIQRLLGKLRALLARPE